MTTQIEKVRRHLEAGKSITPLLAMGVYGISRLSSVIEDLRNEGMEIDTILRRDEEGKQYGEYRKHIPVTSGAIVQVKPGHGVGLPNWVRKTRGARVEEVGADNALIRFTRGKNSESHWLLHKEVVRVA